MKIGRPAFDKPIGTVIGQYQLVSYTNKAKVSSVNMAGKPYRYVIKLYIWECVDCGYIKEMSLTEVTSHLRGKSKCAECKKKAIRNLVGTQLGCYTVKAMHESTTGNLSDALFDLQCKCGSIKVVKSITDKSAEACKRSTHCKMCKPSRIALKPTRISRVKATPLKQIIQDLGSLRDYVKCGAVGRGIQQPAPKEILQAAYQSTAPSLLKNSVLVLR